MPAAIPTGRVFVAVVRLVAPKTVIENSTNTLPLAQTEAPLAPPPRAEPVAQPARSADEALREGPRLPLVVREEAEALVQSHLERRDSVEFTPMAAGGMRARRAVAAYAAQQQGNDREYLSRVLGIDVRV
jgi:hypothetical protein